MKNMKTSILIIACLALLSGIIIANPKLFGIERQRSHIILSQTAVIINAAHKCVTEKKVYNGLLAKAIAHQHVARGYYEKMDYFKALYFSRRARAFAIKAIETNGCLVPADTGYLESDAKLFKDSPNDDELDYLLVKEHRREKLTDEEIINTKPDVDVK